MVEAVRAAVSEALEEMESTYLIGLQYDSSKVKTRYPPFLNAADSNLYASMNELSRQQLKAESAVIKIKMCFRSKPT